MKKVGRAIEVIRISKVLFVLCLLAVGTACKVAVVVVEGGSVQSMAVGSCLEGTVCIHEVTGTDYSESFTAVPNSGWVFEQWSSGDGFFCGGSTQPICAVSNVGTEGVAEIEAVIASPKTFYIMPIFSEAQTTLSEFSNERVFDFNEESQLIDLPSYGTDPSYVEAGKLMCPILENYHKGLGRKFWFDTEVGATTDEVEISFEINLDSEYMNGTPQGEVGKFPGFEGIYDQSAGWGGKPVTDQKSWSVRIANTRQNGNGEVPIGLYVYHPGMSGQYGTTVDANFSLKTGQTYEITLYLKLNDVNEGNGIIRLSVDGQEIHASDDWTLRLYESVHVRSVWLDAYIGGATPSPASTSLSLDNLKIRW